ncbi:YbaB/EbfC family nucleoid-associated protein [Gandjariella thermophila]|uniref:YbaB/EbfC DNA-binding family protein n=1 Tax=Gandjariella thermophila TaxID=1931992 RepID=A0A4D4J6E4_9PSEU|nr:YbaB/EbfC family nucleoid-associated protein [Gandjariella thermophila]GDY30630.1 hypothetical protein GTS_22630 [Gandjariella thermophila]
MSETARQLLRRIEAIDTAAANNRQRAETYQRMADELKGVEGRASSPDGVVTVVAGPGGEITSITFSEQVRAIAPAALSATVLHTIAAARAAAARQQAEVVRRGLGDTELLDRVLDADERLFGDRRPRDPAPPMAIRRPEPVEDTYFEDFNVLRRPGPGR